MYSIWVPKISDIVSVSLLIGGHILTLVSRCLWTNVVLQSITQSRKSMHKCVWLIGLKLTPPGSTNLGMSLRHIERLPIPYVSNCTSEYPANFQFYDFGYAESFCQVECRSLYINRTCGCWHPYIIPAQVNISLFYDIKSKIYLWMELKLVPIAFSFIFNLLLQDGVQRQWLPRSSSVFVLEHLPARISFTAIVPHRVTIQTSRFS